MAPPLQRKPQHVPILALALLWISTSTAQSEVPTNERCPIGHAGKSCSYHAMIRPGQKNCIIHRDFIIGENEVFRNLEGRRYDNVTLLETMEIRVQYNPDQDMILLWDALFEEHVAISKNDKGDDYVVKHYRADGVEHDRHLPTAINRFKITKMSLYSEWILIEYDFVDLSFDILYGGQNVFIFFDEDDSLSFIPTTSECFVQERIPPKVTSDKCDQIVSDYMGQWNGKTEPYLDFCNQMMAEISETGNDMCDVQHFMAVVNAMAGIYEPIRMLKSDPECYTYIDSLQQQCDAAGYSMEYQVCGYACEKTCGSKTCGPTSKCVPGCFCKGNLKSNGDMCVAKTLCGCEGDYSGAFPDGAISQQFCDRQLCQDTYWTDINVPDCMSRCSFAPGIYGINFDSSHFQFNTNNTFTLVKMTNVVHIDAKFGKAPGRCLDRILQLEIKKKKVPTATLR